MRFAAMSRLPFVPPDASQASMSLRKLGSPDVPAGNEAAPPEIITSMDVGSRAMQSSALPCGPRGSGASARGESDPIAAAMVCAQLGQIPSRARGRGEPNARYSRQAARAHVRVAHATRCGGACRAHRAQEAAWGVPRAPSHSGSSPSPSAIPYLAALSAWCGSGACAPPSRAAPGAVPLRRSILGPPPRPPERATRNARADKPPLRHHLSLPPGSPRGPATASHDHPFPRPLTHTHTHGRRRRSRARPPATRRARVCVPLRPRPATATAPSKSTLRHQNALREPPRPRLRGRGQNARVVFGAF